MKRYGIFTTYNCGRTTTHYVEAENDEEMWKEFYKHHNKKKIYDAAIYSWKKMN